VSKKPRPASTYRAARRNAVLRPPKPEKPGVWQGAKPKGRRYLGAARLNRSQNWSPIERYANFAINHPRKHKANP